MLRRPQMRVRVRVQPMHFSFNRMIPNVLTVLALCAGMTAIRLAIVGKFETAVLAIIVAGLVYGVDGRISRGPEGYLDFRRPARLPLGLRELRRGAGGHALRLDHGAVPRLWLGGGADLRGLLRSQARALQYAARPGAAALRLQFLHGRASPGGRRPGDDPDVCGLRVRRHVLPDAHRQHFLDPRGRRPDGEPAPDLRAETLPRAERMGAADAPGCRSDRGVPDGGALGDAAGRRRDLHRLVPVPRPLPPQAQPHRPPEPRRHPAGREPG